MPSLQSHQHKVVLKGIDIKIEDEGIHTQVHESQRNRIAVERVLRIQLEANGPLDRRANLVCGSVTENHEIVDSEAVEALDVRGKPLQEGLY